MATRTDFFACIVAELEDVPILATCNVRLLQDSASCSSSCLAPYGRHLCLSVKIYSCRHWDLVRFGPRTTVHSHLQLKTLFQVRILSIAAKVQFMTLVIIDGHRYYGTPGFFCSYVLKPVSAHNWGRGQQALPTAKEQRLAYQ